MKPIKLSRYLVVRRLDPWTTRDIAEFATKHEAYKYLEALPYKGYLIQELKDGE